MTRAKYSKRSIQGVGCHWDKKCPLCQTKGYNKIVDRGLCHVISNGQVIILNEAIRSPTSSPIPVDMDYSVVPELIIPKQIEGVTSDEMEYQQYLDSHTDDVKIVHDYEYGTPANHNPEDRNHLLCKPRWCYQCDGINIEESVVGYIRTH